MNRQSTSLLLALVLCAPSFGAQSAQQAYVKASNPASDSYFGRVAISGDTVAVGANIEDALATDSGAVYVYARSLGTWTQQAYLKAPSPDPYDYFGVLAIDGDTLVVGAPGEDSAAMGVNGDQLSNSALESGAVYVFVRQGTTWNLQAYLKASNTGDQDYFGSTVAIAGDTLVVGARYEDSAATGMNGDESSNAALDSGAVYVFVRQGATWSQQAYIKASNTEIGDAFGRDVAIAGDTLVVGASSEDSAASGVDGDQSSNGADRSGAAYVFVRQSGAWSQQAYLKASNPEPLDFFGGAVDVAGDTIVVGAIGEDSAATGVNGDELSNAADYSGAAYVFERQGSAWSQQAYVKASNTGIYDHFGWSVAVEQDTIVIGALLEGSATGGDPSDNSAPNAGAAYVFRRGGSGWFPAEYLKASNPGSGDVFGEWVALSGDTVVVGAPGEQSNATGVNGNQQDNSLGDAGAAYVFLVEAGPSPFCAGDGLDASHSSACPCGNTGASGHGCANSANAAGALLATTGTSAVDDVVLLGSGMPPTVACVYLQGDALDDVVFGDGVLCTGGALLRLRTKMNVGGASAFPDGADTVTLSQRGGVTPGSGTARYYQTYYRNAAAFCSPATFNVTNGVRVIW